GHCPAPGRHHSHHRRPGSYLRRSDQADHLCGLRPEAGAARRYSGGHPGLLSVRPPCAHAGKQHPAGGAAG
ncbi:hypothetical protein PBMFNG_PBMFNG_02010, partial [Dysosmobacter welbionis]